MHGSTRLFYSAKELSAMHGSTCLFYSAKELSAMHGSTCLFYSAKKKKQSSFDLPTISYFVGGLYKFDV
jgi:hypothetical protein